MPAQKLKVDFHTHTAEDPRDPIKHTARDLIDRAVRLGFDALAITNHDAVTFDAALEGYAAERKIVLIPGVEITASGRHIIVINPSFEPRPGGHLLREVPSWRKETSLIIAPHPFFDLFKSLGSALFPLLPYLDAIEYTSYYHPWINLNRKAARTAETHRKPLVGVSDCHFLWMFGSTFTLVEAEKNPASIIAAVKAGRCEVRTEPLSFFRMAGFFANIDWVRNILGLYDRGARRETRGIHQNKR